MTPAEWFALLYGEAPPGWLTINSKRDAGKRTDARDPWRTEWFEARRAAEAAARCLEIAEGANVYFGLGLRRARLADGQRGSVSDVAALPGLWIELDVEGEAHAGKGYFATKEDALAFLRGLPRRPTVIVDSGGGYHAYWLFREPWTIDEDEREYAVALLLGWQGYVRSLSGGRRIDSTHDLARVLRVPGTTNRKNGAALPVAVVERSGPRYNPSDFDEWLDWSESKVRGVPGGLVAQEGMQPPADKFLALVKNDNKMAASWEMRRRDRRKDGTPWSPSEYCMSLASGAAAAGWSDQEIVALLVAWRERHKCENRKDAGWYARCVARARVGTERPAEQGTAAARIAETTEPDEKLAGLSEMLGFRVLRIVRRYARDPSGYTVEPSYVLETELGCTEVPDAESLISRTRFRAIIAGHLNRYVEVGAKHWPAVVQAMLDLVVTEEAPIEASPYEEVRAAVLEYARTRASTDDPLKAYDGRMLLASEGQTWFSLVQMMDWARVRKGMKVGPRNLPGMLTSIGCKRMRVQNVRRGEKSTALSFWSLPEVK